MRTLRSLAFLIGCFALGLGAQSVAQIGSIPSRCSPSANCTITGLWTFTTAPAGAGALPAGSGTELQARSSATAFQAVTGSSWDGSRVTLPDDLTVTDELVVGGKLLPDTNGGADLGSTTLRFDNVYTIDANIADEVNVLTSGAYHAALRSGAAGKLDLGDGAGWTVLRTYAPLAPDSGIRLGSDSAAAVPAYSIITDHAFGLLYGRNAANTLDFLLLDWGLVANNELRIGLDAAKIHIGSEYITLDQGTGITTFVGAMNLSSSGVQLSASDGVLTMLGLGDGNDENLTLDFDNAAANVVAIGTGTGVTLIDLASTINFRAPGYRTTTNCADSAGAAACGAAAAGAVVIDAAATSVVVSTTAVTATSRIEITEDSSLATELGITCNTTLARTYAVTARTAATSFTITTSAAPVTNPACLVYTIVN